MQRYDGTSCHTTLWEFLVTLVSGVAVGVLLATIRLRSTCRREKGGPAPSILSDCRTGAYSPNKPANEIHEEDYNDDQMYHPGDRSRRARLPELIVLVRHGESEGNADHTLYRTRPDHTVNLTARGVDQAVEAGERLENDVFLAYENETGKVLRRVHLTVSPFERTLQTASALRIPFEHRVVRTNIEPRIREQEFGNLQTSEFQKQREEQKRIGRFFYRFPTGESGADVYGRVKSWWFESVLTVNERVGYEPVDAIVVVTHGLTMRFLLMQLYGWSPTTFHSVWNAGNCDVYCLRKSPSKPGLSPYVLDPDLGDMPRSSIEVRVEFSVPPHQQCSDEGRSPDSRTEPTLVRRKRHWTRTFTLQDYLSIPSPRTRQLDIILQKLREQYPDEFRDVDGDGAESESDDTSNNGTASFHSVALMPFVLNQGGDQVWNLIDAAKKSYARRMIIKASVASSSHMSSVTAASASSTSVHHSSEEEPEFISRSSETDERGSDSNAEPLMEMQVDDGNGSLPTANHLPPRCRHGLPASMQQQELSCRFPNFDYWQLGRGPPSSPFASTGAARGAKPPRLAEAHKGP